jgi:hypothetical protein
MRYFPEMHPVTPTSNDLFHTALVRRLQACRLEERAEAQLAVMGHALILCRLE